jgi:trigger factor
MAIITKENIGLLNEKLTVKLSKEDYFPSFEKKLKEYSKKVNMPGFRKGMVPAGMVKKMYGKSIYTDEVLKIVEKELYDYIDTEKPDMFAQPLALNADIEKFDINNPSDYEFGFEIGLKPSFEIASLSNANMIFHKVDVTDEMVEEDVNRMRIKGGKLVESETIDNDENVINILFTESDKDGNVIEGGIVKENSVLLKYFSPSIKKELLGKKKDDVVIFQLSESFEGDKLEAILHDLGFDKNDKEAAKKYFKLTIIKIGLIEKRELNQEYFNEVFPGAAIATEEEFRDKIKKEVSEYWESESRAQLHDQLYHYLLENTKMEFPESFLKRWLQNGGEKQKTAEEAEAEFPLFSSQLKWTLITDKITKDNSLKVSQEELRSLMKAEVSRYFGQMNISEDTGWLESYVDRMMKDEKQVDASHRRLQTEKLFNWVESTVNVKEENITPEGLAAIQHHHHH